MWSLEAAFQYQIKSHATSRKKEAKVVLNFSVTSCWNWIVEICKDFLDEGSSISKTPTSTSQYRNGKKKSKRKYFRKTPEQSYRLVQRGPTEFDVYKTDLKDELRYNW